MLLSVLMRYIWGRVRWIFLCAFSLSVTEEKVIECLSTLGTFGDCFGRRPFGVNFCSNISMKFEPFMPCVGTLCRD